MNESHVVSHSQNISPLSKTMKNKGAFRCCLSVLLPKIKSTLVEKAICWHMTWQGKKSEAASKTGYCMEKDTSPLPSCWVNVLLLCAISSQCVKKCMIMGVRWIFFSFSCEKWHRHSNTLLDIKLKHNVAGVRNMPFTLRIIRLGLASSHSEVQL